MDVCLFLIATARSERAAAPSGIDPAAVENLAASMPGLKSVAVHLPVTGGAHDPYLNAEAPPRCVMQFYFEDLGALEAVLKTGGAAHVLFDPARFPALADCELTQQGMAVRRFATPTPSTPEASARRCTYLVTYEGPADDLNAWLAHYIDSHPPIMARFPNIRAIEIYTRLDYRGDLPAVRSNAMQRNKVVFDSPEALELALNSAVRHEMRADFRHFPPFSGANPHYPMTSVERSFQPAAGATRASR
jgi:hypothetical protein